MRPYMVQVSKMNLILEHVNPEETQSVDERM